MIFTMALVAATAAAPTTFLETVHSNGDQARDTLFSVIKYGLGNAYCPGKCGAVPAGSRLEVVKGAIAFAQLSLQSTTFRERYAQDWAQSEPVAPETVEQQQATQAKQEKDRADELAKSLKELKARIAAEKDPAIKKALQDGYDANIEMQKMMNSPEQKAAMAEMRTVALEQMRAQYIEDKAKFDADHARWLAEKDPKVIIRRRVEEFQALVASVDFKAKVTQRNGRTYFVNPDYESKSAQWKMLYRLGAAGSDLLASAAKTWTAGL